MGYGSDTEAVTDTSDAPGAIQPLRSLRVCFDDNVWVGFVRLASQRTGETVTSRLLAVAFDRYSARQPVQLILSLELLDTIHRVLARQGFHPATVDSFVGSLMELASTGPDSANPTLLLAGRDQIAMHDREDAGILASCFAARADLLVTDNLRDFRTKDAERLDTRTVRTKTGASRQLFALIHERTDDVALVVMHPVDALSWFESGERPTPSAVRRLYGRPS